ncbi:MAG: FHA domain-containing protein [Gammaproteobacteria bacterium]|nr:FHA domain-containing protein [Gammaproteobacteria bacterium]
MSHFKLKGTSGSVINQSFPFDESIVLGSSPDCDVQLDEAGVFPKHAEIRRTGDSSLLLKDLGSEVGTLLNGEPVIESHLGSGDEIRIGTCRLMLQAPGLRPERILTADVVKQPTRRWPRVLAWSLVVASAAAVAVLKLKPEWIDLLRSLY